MAECSSTEYNSPDIYTSSNHQQLRFKKMNKVRDYFIGTIKEREFMRLSKYIASFQYFENSLIVLSSATGSVSITSFTTVI